MNIVNINLHKIILVASFLGDWKLDFYEYHISCINIAKLVSIQLDK